MIHEYVLKDGTTLKAYIYERSWENPEQQRFAVITDVGGFCLGQRRIFSSLSGRKYFKLDTGEKVYLDSYKYIPFTELSSVKGLGPKDVAESIIRTGEENCLFRNAGFRSLVLCNYDLWEIDTSICNIKDCGEIILKPYRDEKSEKRERFDISDFATLISDHIINPVLRG